MLKYILKTLLLLFSIAVFAQVPQAIKYQAVCRDESGMIRSNADVELTLLIHQSSTTGTIVYEETHDIKTNQYGLFSVNLGKGNTLGDFSTIQWGADEFFLEVKVNGISMGTSQLLSVPYALHANDASSLGGASAQEWDKAFMDLMAEVNRLKSMIGQPKDTMLMKSENGEVWKVTVNNDGELVTVQSENQIVYSVLADFFNTQESTPIDENLEYTVPCKNDNYAIYIQADGYFSDLQKVDKCTSIKAELTPVYPDFFNGVAMKEKEGEYELIKYATINVYSGEDPYNSAPITSFETNNNGQFSIDMEPGTYSFGYSVDITSGEYPSFEEYTPVTITTDSYADLKFIYSDDVHVLKPNIYLYPETEQDIQVSISFPQGGQVDVSEPSYGNGWDVNIKPDGTVDNKFGFLFYECTHPDKFQYSKGWIIAKDELPVFFTEKLQAMNFNATEIKDFIDYWIPIFKDAEYYQIYPQFNKEIDPVAPLSITPSPDSLYRLWFCVKESKTATLQIETPVLPVINRNGFEVVEWGVVIK